MAVDSGPRGQSDGLTDRRAERGVLDELAEAVRAGESRVLVVHGEPGVGKTALLEYLDRRAAGCRVLPLAGVQSEMELAFAGVHQLCAPLLGRLGTLPGPQGEALGTAFGMSAGAAPDRFLVGLAVLGLLSEAAGEQPVLCVVDDAQWLDQASAQVLAFVARRLGAEPVGLVFGTRAAGGELAGLPELAIGGLAEADARVLLDSVLTGPVDARVREQIIAETGGNPLALMELPRMATLGELAGGFGLPGALPLAGRIDDSFRRQIDALPAQTRRLLLVAAADPTGNPLLVWRAAGRLEIGAQAAAPAAEAGLAEFGARVRFRHPLVRSAAYQSAPDRDRQEAHRALAAAGPDEDVAAELEHSAGRAQARGGRAAAAAFLERAAALTPDPDRRAGRMLAAAQAYLQAGGFGKALELLTAAEAGPLDELQAARADLLRGQVAFASRPGSDAPPLLLKAARQLEPLDPDLARETYLDAWEAAMFARHVAAGDGLEEVSRAARALPGLTHLPRRPDLLLDGLTLLVTDGPAAAAPILRQATSAFASADIPAAEILRWGRLARAAAEILWDDEGWCLTARQVQLARDVGALDQLPILLPTLAVGTVWWGDFAAAASLMAEADAAGEATGAHVPVSAGILMMLACFRGSQAAASALTEAATERGAAGGQGGIATWARWAAAVLYNGLGRYSDALAAARQASEYGQLNILSLWALPELVEAAVRSGNGGLAGDALSRLAESARAGGTDWGLGTEARCRALLAEGAAAEPLYQEAIDRLGRTRMRPMLARTQLLYGEWLRRQRRPADARGQLRNACQMLEQIGMEAFAQRGRRELRAAGGTTRKRAATTTVKLTAQEGQIARLAADGLSNPEIGTRLFLSPRTVQFHLRKVFIKLDITSRAQLSRALSGS